MEPGLEIKARHRVSRQQRNLRSQGPSKQAWKWPEIGECFTAGIRLQKASVLSGASQELPLQMPVGRKMERRELSKL